MDWGDVSQYLETAATVAGYGGILYLTTMTGLSSYDILLRHSRIKSQEELDAVVEEEAFHLELDPGTIEARYGEPSPSLNRAFVTKTTVDGYVIGVPKNTTRNIVKHELYHIYRGDCEQEEGAVNAFLAENRAILYQSLGITM